MNNVFDQKANQNEELSNIVDLLKQTIENKQIFKLKLDQEQPHLVNDPVKRITQVAISEFLAINIEELQRISNDLEKLLKTP